MFGLLKTFTITASLLTIGALSAPSAAVATAALTAAVTAKTSAPKSLSANFVSTHAVGDIGAVQLNDGNTRLYFQDSTGAIVQYVVSNSFDKGTFQNAGTIVPAAEVKWGTSIATTMIGTGTGYEEIHLFFFSPDNILSEYIWAAGVAGGFHGGANCTNDCITPNGWLGCGTGSVLYAMENPSTNQLRVGFVSAAEPDTITEAIRNGNTWQLSELN